MMLSESSTSTVSKISESDSFHSGGLLNSWTNSLKSSSIHNEVNVLNKTTKRSAVSSDRFSGLFIVDDAILSWYSRIICDLCCGDSIIRDLCRGGRIRNSIIDFFERKGGATKKTSITFHNLTH